MRQPDRSDFAALYDEHIWRIYGFFGYRVRSRADAEDLTQQTFERALRAWDRFDPARASESTWLIAIAQNLLVDHYRKERPERMRPLDGEPAKERLGELAAADDELGISAELADALEVLSDRDREVLALKFGGDLTGPEIAELTGLSLANVQQILSRSLRRLRSELEPALPAASGF